VIVARALLDAGERALASDEIDAVTARLAALPLFRGACAAALRELSGSASAPPGLAATAREWLVEAAGDESRLQAVAALLERSEDDPGLGALRPIEAGALNDLRRLARRLVRAAETTQFGVAHLALQRALRPLAALAIVCAAALAVVGTVRWIRTPHDLAHGARWRASSAFEGYVSTGTLDEVQPAHLVFHTVQEHEPWIEIDLGSRRTIHAARIVARQDCCRDRTSAGVIEVSDDQLTFREVARWGRPFKVWNPSFAPTRARFVRLRQLNDNFFHLSAISIY
jgi:hypothetical protein